MPAIHIGTLFIGREDWESNNSSGITTEDDNDTNAEAGGGTSAIFWRLSSTNFGRGVSGG